MHTNQTHAYTGMRSRLLGLFLTMVVLMTASLSAQAQFERETTTRTGWWWYHGVTPDQVTNLVQTNKARLTSIRVESASPLKLTVAMVKNSGVYAKSWWWYYGISGSQVNAYLEQHNACLLDLEPYIVNGSLRFAAIMVPKDGTGWWWYYGISPTALSQKLQQNNARLISLRSYIQNGQRVYAAVMIANTGANARGWWWYYGISFDQVVKLVNTQPAKRLIAMQQNDVGNYNVIFLQNSPYVWGYFSGATPTFLTNTAVNNNLRIIDAQMLSDGNCLGIMIQNY